TVPTRFLPTLSSSERCCGSRPSARTRTIVMLRGAINGGGTPWLKNSKTSSLRPLGRLGLGAVWGNQLSHHGRNIGASTQGTLGPFVWVRSSAVAGSTLMAQDASSKLKIAQSLWVDRSAIANSS